jgi:prophage DNA circulation protein
MDDKELLEAKYTAPSGKEFIFLWEKTLSKITELKTGIFSFPDKDGAHVQHQGGGPVSFPMTCIFNGDNHVKRADDFEAALYETDVAELQHPVYGIRKVIPTGNISRDNDLINSINESTVTITFTETITDDPVNLEAVTADELEESFDEFTEAAAVDFAENISVENIGEKLFIQSVLDTQTDILNENLSNLAPGAEYLTNIRELKDNIRSMFNNTENSVTNKLNTARLAMNLIKSQSRAVIGVSEKIKGYSKLIIQITNQFKNDPFGVNDIKNLFSSTRLILSASVASIASGSALSIAKGTSSGVLSRESAVTAAVEINNLLSTIQNFEDIKIEKNNFIDTNASAYLLLVELVNNSINLILNTCFSLPMKRTIKLGQDRNFIELCAELYGSVDNEYMDKLIIENNLNIDDLEIIPMGREVSYYV